MQSQLVCRPVRDRPVAVLRLSGTLDPVTGDALQVAVRHSLATKPHRLLLDVSGLRIGDPVGVSALSDVVCQTADWPDVPIVLCGASPETAAVIQAAPDCAELSFASDCETALAEAVADPVPPEVRVRLRPVPDSCRQVRQLVTECCDAWQRSDLGGTAALIATELVANVVRHAHTSMEFTFGLRDGRLRMSVRDGSRRMPKPADPDRSAPGGRGLWLVRDLTDAWGVLPVTDGKVVWTRLSTAA
ncbi:anti-anti-sigma regulatory factor [Actinoplanes tereljensis]|uniref:Sulfate transporter n=1 Tax=Paractinoplanes tereljensis TaxID=571912 RepID=A0A919NX10_9ACTN|nr:ATP-binding protein [Actinoplanes tereljensis]GIF26896.1 sulfate transporter [Actinoplanes tereljensis]